MHCTAQKLILIFFPNYHGAFLCIEIHQKVFVASFENVFHVYLRRGLEKYASNLIITIAFTKIGQPIQPIWLQFFALSWSALKKLCSKHFLEYFNTLEIHRDFLSKIAKF
jgi:hypothetical protein